MDQGYTWREKYRFHIDRIDEQHGILFDLIDTLESALASDERWMVLHSLLEEIQHWAKIHFSVEESLMEILAYPDLDDHLASHVGFLRMLESKKAKSLKEDVAAETAVWLREWLSHHIDVEDRKYVSHFRRFVPSSPFKS